MLWRTPNIMYRVDQKIKKITINDWVSSAIFYENSTEFCFITAHNIAQHVSIDTENKELVLLDRGWCEDSSTLYCSKVIGDDWKSTIVFSGTALGEVLIWQPKFGENKSLRSPVLYRLSGHKGVVFSIDVSFKYKLITTTSDDRSVRLWHIENNPNIYSDEKLELNVIAGKSLFGHKARVFKSKIIVDDKTICIASVGEDSFLCLWNLHGKLLLKKKTNYGATIWDLDYCNQQKKILTSGSDSSITQTLIGSYMSSNNLNQNIKLINYTNENNNDEYISKIKYLECNVLVGLTNSNKIVYKMTNHHDWMKSEKLNYKSCVLEIHQDLIVTAGFEYVTIHKYNITNHVCELLHNVHVMNSMIRSFHFVADNHAIFCDDKGTCFLLNEQFEIENRFDLPKCKERWSTVAFKFEDIILIGDRCGNLNYYKHDRSTNKFEIRNSLKTVHGHLGTTNIKLIENSMHLLYILTSGHDGTLKTLELNKITDKLTYIHTEKTEVLWIEKVLMLKNNENVLIGFNDNHFVVWSKYQGVIYELECGGRHRYWDCKRNTPTSEFLFTFIRNRKLYEISFQVDQWTDNLFNIKSVNWHKGSCNVVQKLHTLSNDTNDVTIATGGDDNILKIFKRFSQIAEIFTHISSIRCITSFNINENDILIISGGGRAQICLTKICLNLSEKIKAREIHSFMLKSSDLQRKKLGINQVIDFDPETRFMCLATLLFENSLKIFVGCSDGYIREFLIKNIYDEIDLTITLQQSMFYGRCILNIVIMKSMLITMSTDGYISFWNIETLTENSTYFYRIRHHNSGINCFDILPTGLDEFKIITGGDDQNIVLSSFEFNESIKTINKIKSETLHTAQITGIKFINQEYCCSVGVDQKLNYFKIENLCFQKTSFSCISDVKGLTLINNDGKLLKALVYGSGIEIIDIDL